MVLAEILLYLSRDDNDVHFNFSITDSFDSPFKMSFMHFLALSPWVHQPSHAFFLIVLYNCLSWNGCSLKRSNFLKLFSTSCFLFVFINVLSSSNLNENCVRFLLVLWSSMKQITLPRAKVTWASLNILFYAVLASKGLIRKFLGSKFFPI